MRVCLFRAYLRSMIYGSRDVYDARRGFLTDPDFEPDAVWIAIPERKRRGPTALEITDPDPLRGYAGLAEVRRTIHCRGVATALKRKPEGMLESAGSRWYGRTTQKTTHVSDQSGWGFQPMPTRPALPQRGRQQFALTPKVGNGRIRSEQGRRRCRAARLRRPLRPRCHVQISP